MSGIEYVKVRDIDGIKKLPYIGTIYEVEGEFFTCRVDFYEEFDGFKDYMIRGTEIVFTEDFSEEELRLMKSNNYEGKYIYKLVLSNHKVVSHYFTFIGMNTRDSLIVAPYKIPKENMYTIDPELIRSTNWYYMPESDAQEYL